MSEAELFEQIRPGLLALAWRILRSRADAEDAVQDTWIKWREADRARIESPLAWLATVCKRRCLDALRAHHRLRVDHGDIPETTDPADAAERMEHAASLAPAFGLVLTRLSPKERAAWLLCEVFEQPRARAAALLRMSEQACQKLVERARASVARDRERYAVGANGRLLLRSFQWALATGDLTELTNALSRDVSPCLCTATQGTRHDHAPQRTCADRRRSRQDRQSRERAAERARHRHSPRVAFDDAGLRLDAA